jgi:hypothetical protein
MPAAERAADRRAEFVTACALTTGRTLNARADHNGME